MKNYIKNKDVINICSKLNNLNIKINFLLVESDKKLKYNIKSIKVSDILKDFVDFDLIILINKDFWDNASENLREASVYHELKHYSIKNGKLIKCKHDIEEFADVLNKYGLYKEELNNLKDMLKK